MTRRTAAAPVEPPGSRPFLKWPGGKAWLTNEIERRLPGAWGAVGGLSGTTHDGRYFEPFMGGAALFWALQPKRAVLSDANAELVNLYRVVRDDVEALISTLAYYTGAYAASGEKLYYRVRDTGQYEDVAFKRAARTIFLNKAGFNGLYRVSRKGKFNVPHGRTASGKPPTICDSANLRACSAALQGVEIKHAHFESAMVPMGNYGVRVPAAGDLMYIDSPYVPEPGKSSFTAYTKEGFGDDQQQELASAFRSLAGRGVYVLASNSRTERVRELYRGFRMIEVARPGGNNSDTSKRQRVPELLILGWERA